MVGKTKTQNAADRQRMKIMAEIPCIPCMVDGKKAVPATVQHRTDCGRRMEDEHQQTYRSCPWHHLGEVPPGYRGSISRATLRHGPSIAHDRRTFAYVYGTEEELVMLQDALIRMVESANRRGEYLTTGTLRRLTKMLHREIVTGVSPVAAEVYTA